MSGVFTSEDLTHNWGNYNFSGRKITVFDTSLRDGLQSPHPQKQPSLAEKIKFLECTYELGIEAIELGFPVASPSHRNEVIELAKYAVTNQFPLLLSCLARTTKDDIEAVAEVSQRSGTSITANILVGSSKIRRIVEDWDLNNMIGWIKGCIHLAKKYNLPVEFVTEDATRTDPETLYALYTAAINEGVERIWIADTVGDATPNSTKAIIAFFVEKIIGNKKIGLDWHGHDDKGLGVANSLEAVQSGADRIQATALGIGERAGNAPMEPVIINLALAGSTNYDLKKLYAYSESASKMYGIPIRNNYPGIGKFVHSTAAGMHGAAILKARKAGREDLVGLVYSPFHPKIFDRELELHIGPMSGRTNVEWNLKRLGLIAESDQVEQILEVAKGENRFLIDEDVKKIFHNEYSESHRIQL